MSKLKKIAIIGPAHPYRGGIAALNDRLALELIKEGHDVQIWNFKLQYPGFLFPGKTQYTSDPAPEGLVIHQKINSISPWNWICTGLQIRKSSPDLIIVRYWLPFMGPALGTICRMARSKKTKIIALVDNMLPHEKRPGDMLFTRYFSGSVDGFIAMSESVYSDIDLFDLKKPKGLCPHPIYDYYGQRIKREESLKLLGLDPSFRYMLFFGFIRQYKGLDLLLEAMAQPSFSELPVKLIIAGEFYEDEQKYLTLIEKLNLKDKIILHCDYIPNDEVNRYFGAADIVVQPYRSATQSGVTQVGYHFNKPMLVTNVGGLSEIITHGKAGYVVEPDSKSISEALVDFFKEDKLSFFEENVKEEKKRFSWERMTRTIFSVAEQIDTFIN
ncbi:MAG: glycosyltransferase [Bacteroidota bacterium]|nr:glycosyltransferase [Bacteroidota bacterium]